MESEFPDREAVYRFSNLIHRLIADFLIWIFVVHVPIFEPPTLLIWLVMWLLRRRRCKELKASPANR